MWSCRVDGFLQAHTEDSFQFSLCLDEKAPVSPYSALQTGTACGSMGLVPPLSLVLSPVSTAHGLAAIRRVTLAISSFAALPVTVLDRENDTLLLLANFNTSRQPAVSSLSLPPALLQTLSVVSASLAHVLPLFEKLPLTQPILLPRSESADHFPGLQHSKTILAQMQRARMPSLATPGVTHICTDACVIFVFSQFGYVRRRSVCS